jgi:putative glutamine amidotransferase
MGNEFPPRIGISARLRSGIADAVGNARKDLLGAERSLIDLVAERGGIPLILAHPSSFSRAALRSLARHLVDGISGLLLQGGGDLAPQWYGGAANTTAADIQRDEFELALLEAALVAGKPVLGICRGCQLLNVAHGGSLFRQVQSEREFSIAHSDRQHYDDYSHGVRLAPAGLLAGCYGREQGQVTSAHDQGIATLAGGLTAEAWCSEDGLVEALRSDSGWAVGVQWHPELQRDKPALLPPAPLFDAFLAAVAPPQRDFRNRVAAWP